MKEQSKTFLCWCFSWTALIISIFLTGYFFALNFKGGIIMMNLISIFITVIHFWFIEQYYKEEKING